MPDNLTDLAYNPQMIAPQQPNPAALASPTSMGASTPPTGLLGNTSPEAVQQFVKAGDTYQDPYELNNDQAKAKYDSMIKYRQALDTNAAAEAKELYKSHPFVKAANLLMPGFEQAYFQGKLGPMQAVDAALHKHMETMANDLAQSSTAHYKGIESKVKLAQIVATMQNDLALQPGRQQQELGGANASNASANYLKAQTEQFAQSAEARRSLESEQGKAAGAQAAATPQELQAKKDELAFKTQQDLHLQLTQAHTALTGISHAIAEKQAKIEAIRKDVGLLVSPDKRKEFETDKAARIKEIEGDITRDRGRYSQLESRTGELNGTLQQGLMNTNAKGTDKAATQETAHNTPDELLSAAKSDPIARQQAIKFHEFIKDKEPTQELYDEFLKQNAPKAQEAAKPSRYKEAVKNIKTTGALIPPPPPYEPSVLPQMPMQQGTPQYQQQAPLPGQDPMAAGIIQGVLAGAGR